MEIWSGFFASFLPPEENAFEPMLDVYYPIINDVSPNAVLEGGSNNATSTRAVGMLVIPTYWRSFIRNILTEKSDGIVVVVENPCAQSFTYQIFGPRVVYLGVGDLHDSKYDDIVVSSSIIELKNYTTGNAHYNGAPINADYCPSTIHVYPSDTMKADFMSKDATFFLVSVIMIFLFTSCVFFIYDCYVERRQLRVTSAAKYSSAIVSSLFPSTVRELIFPKPDDAHKARRRLSGFCTESPASVEDLSCDTTTPIIGNPIAQIYPDTTVIFADIVGFTAWSSSRDPIQVFRLLETIYAGFDALARAHGVFKIETIGDSYVAVVGLPKSCKRHAVVMAKFANAMRAKMISMTNELEKILGEVSPTPFADIFLQHH
jgi:Adenylate and Guanylate cyclase catalytic domain